VICASPEMSRSTKYSTSSRGTGGVISCGTIAYRKVNTVELCLSGLSGTAINPDMQKIRIIGLFFKNKLHFPFEVEKFLQTTVLGYIIIYVQIKY